MKTAIDKIEQFLTSHHMSLNKKKCVITSNTLKLFVEAESIGFPIADPQKPFRYLGILFNAKANMNMQSD